MLEVTEAPNTTIVRLKVGRLDHSNVQQLGDELTRVADQLPQPWLRLDLQDVEYVDSLALAKVVVLHRKLAAAGGRLTLLNPAPMVSEVFRVTRLDSVLDLRR